jgi:hypothetical protein
MKPCTVARWMMCVVALGAAAGCKRDVKVSVCRSNTVVLASLAAGAQVWARPALGDVLGADRPPKLPPPGWWVDTPRGRGFMDGRSGTLHPVEGALYVVESPSVDVLDTPSPNGKLLVAHSKGTPLKLAPLPDCAVPDDWLAVVEDGTVRGFVPRASVAAR